MTAADNNHIKGSVQYGHVSAADKNNRDTTPRAESRAMRRLRKVHREYPSRALNNIKLYVYVVLDYACLY
jgi:hypothetical protein